ncbi:MAG TPA: hypothetical protein VLJ59_15995 [Mycobacteriales bacterium]|nr:hypothetical protein [Mycobacteriales bacterium]
MSLPVGLTLAHHDDSQAGRLLDVLCATYADAYGVEPDGGKVTAFRERVVKGKGLVEHCMMPC